MRKLLVVVDMQNDFINGPLGTPEARDMVGRAAAYIAKYAPEDVFATRDTHEESYLDTQEGRNLPVAHCVRGTRGWELDPEIKKALGRAEIIDKPAFGSVTLAEKIAALAKEGPVEISLIGLCTDICVVSNALLLKAFLPEVPIKVAAACCAGVTPQSHEAALTTMKMCQIEIV